MSTRVACVQSNVVFNDPQANAANCIAKLGALKKQGVDLAVFPEAFLTGYCVTTLEEAMLLALPLESDRYQRVTNAPAVVSEIQEACTKYDIFAVVGLLTTDGTDIYNTALLFDPEGTTYRYNKTHLPHLGADRFTIGGWDLPVFETKIGKIGILICFDIRVPEAARTLALNGAEIIVLPTNWPVGSETSPAHFTVVRAAENRVFLATANRVGAENGTTFIGQSGIYGLTGETIAKASDDKEEIICADIDLELAQDKRTVNIPGEYELDYFGCRRPGLYSKITKL